MNGKELAVSAGVFIWIGVYVIVILALWSYVFTYKFPNVWGISDLVRLSQGRETGI